MRSGRTTQKAHAKSSGQRLGYAGEVETLFRKDRSQGKETLRSARREQRIRVVLDDPKFVSAHNASDVFATCGSHRSARGILYGRHRVQDFGAGRLHRAFK